jgi:hypothetical protein
MYPNKAVEEAVRQAAADPQFEPGMSVRLVSLGASPTGWEEEPESKRPLGPVLRVFSDEDAAVAWLGCAQ